MGNATDELTDNGTTSSASARVICEEFLKVLGRKEVEQPMICQNLCLCAQFWRYQHYLLPLWKQRGITKMVCFGLGSFRNVQQNGGPFPGGPSKQQHTYRAVIRDKTPLQEEFNTRPVDRHDALQAMLRHVAAVEVASMLKFCSSRRGVEHQLIKYYFKKLTAVQDLPTGGAVGIDEKTVKKLGKMPPTAGYAGDEDLVDVPVYLWDGEYAEQDRDALGRLAAVFEVAHLPPVEVVEGGDVRDACRLVDEHTLVYAVDPDFPVRSMVLGRCKPGAMIWRDHAVDVESDVLVNDIRPLLDDYEEFKLDKRHAPHTVGSSHLYIRKDIVEAAEREKIVPPYPVTFPHDYPYKLNNWYLDKLERNGSGKVQLKEGDGGGEE
ncbi:hypothetical protein C8A01DRAFT_50424 [Parachaetomium inaequale]|uniref:Uncharacterized protein n=1 Tax=Parachaetomium inaequale TaxID=2588326 RepID=A0AAN6SMT0_9PEZI|nr:hypothetical protein C8A01DRAFT_50424 [Parachaetomium inaequale]